MHRDILLALVISSSLLAGFSYIEPVENRQKSPDSESMARGKKIYDSYCFTCHQSDGSGVPGVHPPLIKTKWVLGEKKELAAIVIHGMNGEIEVNGEQYANQMPGNPHFSDQQVADVATYVRNSFGNKASAVTVEDVKLARTRQTPARH